MPEYMLMKDGLGDEAIDRIAQSIKSAWPDFDSDGFQRAALVGIDKLELKQRVNHLIKVLHQFLPKSFREAAEILDRVPANWDFGDPSNSIRGFAAWPIIDYAATYGLEEPEISLPLLKQLTHLHTAEFAIRPFILRYPELCFSEFNQWINNENHHIRRLVSEGSRPRLPWGIRLTPFCKNPSPLLPLLEALNNDSSDYVRRSVANSLNDISKDNPDIAVEVCSNWLANSPNNKTKWIVRHAMRSLIKSGRPDVFPLLGFTEKPKVKIEPLNLKSTELSLGDSLEFNTVLHSQAKTTQYLAIDFAIHHRKANGSLSPKVFKWKEAKLNANESLALSKKHGIKKINTRKYYSGIHQLDLIVNGKVISSQTFTLNGLS